MQKMKRLIMALATVIAVAMPLWADTETVGGYTWTYRINGNTAEIYKGSWSAAISPSPTGDLTVPDTLGGKTVTSIGSSAFYGCSALTSVTIPDSVTCIGVRAFYDCSNSLFDTTTIPGVKLVNGWAVGNTGSLFGTLDLTGIRGIGDSAFLNSSGLTNVTIGNGVTSIGGGAFSGCSGLTSVTIPDSVTSIGSSAFYGCSGLRDVTVPQYVLDRQILNVFSYSPTNVSYSSIITSIGDWAFAYCRGLTSVTIPESVTRIGEYAFQYCSGLTSVTIPSSVTSIGYRAFLHCSGLTSVTISDSVTRTSIGSEAFSGCSGLTNVTIGNGVTSIGGGAFSGCSRLTSVTIPNSVTSIGSSAFYGCSGLTAVTIPDSVTSIGASAFRNCSSLTSVILPMRFRGVVGRESSVFDECPLSLKITYKDVKTGSSGTDADGAGAEFTGEEKKVFTGAVFDADGMMRGLAQVETAKASKKGVRVKGFVILEDGRKVSLKGVEVPIVDGRLSVETTVGRLGAVSLTVFGDGFRGTLGDMTVVSADVGEEAGVLSGSLTLKYIDAAGKVKSKRIMVGGVAAGGTSAGTITSKGSAAKSFAAEFE